MSNIIIAGGSLYRGGAERMMIFLAQYLYKHNHDVTIMTGSRVDEEYKVPLGIKRISLSDYNMNSSSICGVVKITEFLSSMIERDSIDLVIIMGKPVSCYILPGCIKAKTKVIISERNDPRNFAGKKITKLISDVLIKHADGYVFQTNDAKNYYNRRGIRGGVVIHNPVFEESLPEISQLEKKPIIVNVGRLNNQKNQKMLIEAFDLIKDKYSKYCLEIYGEGVERQNLEKLIHEKNLEKRVVLVGNVQDVIEKIQNAELFVLSSDFEGMPNALIEAMAMGLPCISTDCPIGGPRELIDNNINGCLVKVGDVSGLAIKMDELLKDSSLRNMIGKNALTIRDKLSEHRIGTAWLKYCEEVVKK